MLWSQLFIPTLREAPAGVDDPGMRLLIRAGYWRGGVHLALGQRSLARIAAMVRAELNALGGQEMLAAGGPLSAAASGGLRSYKQLPQLWFQIGSSVEICGFDADGSFERPLQELFSRILTKCGLPFSWAEASGGRELLTLSPHGVGKVAWCEEAGYAATLEVAHAMPKPALAADPEGALTPERFHTPGRKTIADLVEFTGLPATSQMKSLVQVCDGKPYLVLVRGDHQLERSKLAAAVGASEARPATVAEISGWFGAAPGSLGPMGVTAMPILADLCLQGRRNMICGANEDDYHLRHVTPGVDFAAQFLDLRRVEEGDMCPSFPAGVEIRTAHSLGRVARVPAELKISDDSGREMQPVLTLATLALDEVLRVAAELRQDADGLTFEAPMAPFDVVITAANYADASQREAAQVIYNQCFTKGLTALLDDRDERPGVKFKDADLIGIPTRITIGKKLVQGLVEVVQRHPRQSVDLPVADAVQ